MNSKKSENSKSKSKWKDEPNILSSIFFWYVLLCFFDTFSDKFVFRLSHISWTIPLFIKGYKNVLSEEDTLGPVKTQESGIAGDKLEDSWNKEIYLHEHPSLWRAVCRVYAVNFLCLACLWFICELAK